MVKVKNKPHVVHNSGKYEWYTPAEYIELARKVMGSIDCDPASSEVANELIKASIYYTVEDDGLIQDWKGNVWLNPPYSRDLIKQFTDKLIKEIEKGNVKQAMVLTNNATETRWYQNIAKYAQAIFFIKGRVKFIDGNTMEVANVGLQGQSMLYFGDDVDRFLDYCSKLDGIVCKLDK